jgi:hypothetical protein
MDVWTDKPWHRTGKVVKVADKYGFPIFDTTLGITMLLCHVSIDLHNTRAFSGLVECYLVFLWSMPVFSYICIVVFKHNKMTRSYIFSLVVVIIMHGAECHRCPGPCESFWGLHISIGHQCAISQILLLHLLNWFMVSIAFYWKLRKDHVLSSTSIIDWVNLFFFVSGHLYNL